MAYRAGIIGTGGIAGMGIFGMHDQDAIGEEKIRASHAGGYRESDDIELVAIADIDEEKLTTFGEAWDIPPERRYPGHDSLLDAESLDIVSVCTPSYLHGEHVITAARSNANPEVIWCEKPIASQVSAAEEMINVCEETETELLIGHSFRFTDKLQTLKRLIREENIVGDINSISAQFRMELLRNSTHLLDTILYLLDARASRVSGYINEQNEAVDALDTDHEVDDAGGGGFIQMDDGTFATIDCTIPRSISSMCFSIIGTEGKLYLNNDDGEWRYWRIDGDEHVEESLPGLETSWTWERDYKDSFSNTADHMADILSGKVDNHSPGVEAKRSLEIIVGFYVSHYTGSQVTIPLDRPLRDVTITSW